MFKNLKLIVNNILSLAGYKIVKIKTKSKVSKSDKINLNIGSGKTSFVNFINLDKTFNNIHNNNYNEYDLTRDKLNFKNNSVDNIYVSHVIEHFNDNIVKDFLVDAVRVLKKDGVIRISCPDAEFLFNVSSFNNDYWNWRNRWFKERNISLGDLTQIDYLIQEISTNKLRFFNKENDDIYKKIKNNFKYDFAMETLTSKQESFDDKIPPEHVNYFDKTKIESFFNYASKKNNITNFKIIQSKPNGSVSKEMQSTEFDNTHPQMSIYVDFVKMQNS